MEALEFWSNILTAWAWPLVVAALGGYFLVREHEALGRLVDRIRSAAVGPLKFDASKEAVNATLEAERALASIGDENDADAETEDDEHEGAAEGVPELPAEPDDKIVMTHDELSALVTEFAEAGWAVRGLERFSEFPEPMLRWQDGRPNVFVWRGRNSRDQVVADSLNLAATRTAELRAEYEDLSGRIREAQAQAARPGIGGEERHMAHQRLDALMRRRDDVSLALGRAERDDRPVRVRKSILDRTRPSEHLH